jgi:hypothetical protein
MRDEIARWENGPDGRRWTWDRDRLEQVIRRTPGLFVCGVAINLRDMWTRSWGDGLEVLNRLGGEDR